MMQFRLIGICAIAACLSGCSVSGYSNSSFTIEGGPGHSVIFRNAALRLYEGKLYIHAQDRSLEDAQIDASGNLVIDHIQRPENDQQRDLLKRYYAGALNFCNRMMAPRNSCDDSPNKPAMVVGDLIRSNPSPAAPCDLLNELASIQHELDEQFEAFRPYGLIKGSTVDGCPAT